jgi:hypothetical protein
MVLLPGGPNTPKVLAPMGPRPDRAQVERFKAEQEKKGFTVVEGKGGELIVTPKDGRTP